MRLSLILHTSLALDPDFGQPLGLLWEKLWHREKSQKPPISEEAEQKKQRLKEKRKTQRKKPFEEKESYRWVEEFEKVENLFSSLKTPIGGQTSRVIHVFDRELEFRLSSAKRPSSAESIKDLLKSSFTVNLTQILYGDG